MNRTIVISFLSLFAFSGWSQKSVSKQAYLQEYSFYKVEKKSLSSDHFFEAHAHKMGLSAYDEFYPLKVDKGMNGFTHIRYQQYHNDLKVIGGDYILHLYQGQVVKANGDYLPRIDITTLPTISKKDALDFAKQDMNAEKYSWESQMASITDLPDAELVILDRDFPEFSGYYHLAYRVKLRSLSPSDGQEYFIDAHNGRVISKISLHKDGGVPAVGTTRYYGEQAITIDSISESEYVLRDPTRGADGINVYNNGTGNLFTSNSTSVDLTNENQDEVAVDALYLTTEYYDLLKSEFGWFGIDNENSSMNVCVHARGGAEYVNAYWDGRFAWFGDGDCNHGPLVTAEVLAHELMHGIIDYTSELVYSDESGAINESMADIMGQYLEYKLDKDNFSWDIGNSIALQEKVEPFRVLDNPTAKGHPEYYKGPLWRDGANVHTNSAIGNLVFVMLSDGKEDLDFDGKPYAVTGIGVEQAAKFLFHTNRHYLTSTSTYTDYYNACLISAEEFFPNNLAMLENIKEAWRAVGVSPPYSGEDVYDLVLSSRGYIPTCAWGEYDTLAFTITNLGTIPYYVQEEGYVIVRSRGKEKEVFLDQDILPGESMEFRLDSFILLTDDFISVQYELVVDDIDTGNSSFDYYSVTEHMENDLELRVEVSDPICFQSERNLQFRVRNQSCTTLAEGTSITISLEDINTGQIVFSEVVELENNLLPNARVTFERTLELGLTESKFYGSTLQFSDDNNLDDNMAEVSIEHIVPITDEYNNGFDSDSDLTDEILLRSDFASNHIYSFDGDPKFYTTGFFSEADEPLCVDPSRNWDKDPESIFDPLSAHLQACLDLEGMEAMALQFDLTQYRNDLSEFASAESSSMRLKLVGTNDEETHVIKSQTEGETVSHTYPIPANFRGSMEMLFLTHTGDEPSLDYDIILLNDLAVTGSVDIEEVSFEASVHLYPNPALDRLFVNENRIEVISCTITNIAGQNVLEREGFSEEAFIYIGHLDAGYYNTELKTKSGKTIYRQFIKL